MRIIVFLKLDHYCHVRTRPTHVFTKYTCKGSFGSSAGTLIVLVKKNSINGYSKGLGGYNNLGRGPCHRPYRRPLRNVASHQVSLGTSTNTLEWHTSSLKIYSPWDAFLARVAMNEVAPTMGGDL